MTRHFLEVDDLSAAQLGTVLSLAAEGGNARPLEGRGVALLFEKPSARTRNSSEMAVNSLGGHPVSIRGDEVGLDGREAVEDVARTLACYHAVIAARVFRHETLLRMSRALDSEGMAVPVVNLLSDQGHPCQVLADLLTLEQSWGRLEGRSLAWVGDANNVCRSLALGCAATGVELRIAAPNGYGMASHHLARARELGGTVLTTASPLEAVANADAVYTDVWTSMGQESERASRLAAFKGFTVDEALVASASPKAVVLHCLPAHRGEEITAEVLEGPQSVVWRQAANRMHAMRGLLTWLVEGGT